MDIPPPPRPAGTSRVLPNFIPETEIELEKDRYVNDEIDIEELELRIEGWLRWSKLSPQERLQFEDKRPIRHAPPLPKPSMRRRTTTR
jgi:hypothetical protein